MIYHWVISQEVLNKTVQPSWKTFIQTMELVEAIIQCKAIKMHFTSKRCYSRIKIKLEIATTQGLFKMTWMSWKMLETHSRCQW